MASTRRFELRRRSIGDQSADRPSLMRCGLWSIVAAGLLAAAPRTMLEGAGPRPRVSLESGDGPETDAARRAGPGGPRPERIICVEKGIGRVVPGQWGPAGGQNLSNALDSQSQKGRSRDHARLGWFGYDRDLGVVRVFRRDDGWGTEADCGPVGGARRFGDALSRRSSPGYVHHRYQIGPVRDVADRGDRRRPQLNRLPLSPGQKYRAKEMTPEAIGSVAFENGRSGTSPGFCSEIQWQPIWHYQLRVFPVSAREAVARPQNVLRTRRVVPPSPEGRY
jgi:hypothetical protein